MTRLIDQSLVMPKFVLGARKSLLPNWAVAGVLAGFVAATYLYSIRAVASDNLDQEISRQLQELSSSSDEK